MNETSDLAKWMVELKWVDIPREVIDYSKILVLDTLGCMLGGSIQDSNKAALRYTRAMGGSPDSTVVNYGDRTNPFNAAFINASFGHGWDFDDMINAGAGHAVSACTAATMALAEKEIISGREFLEAWITGYEVSNRVGAATKPGHLKRGFHEVGTIGPFAGSAAASKILRLNEWQSENAIGITVSQAAGTFQHSQTTGGAIKRCHAGFAAASGVRSALLAKEGMTAAREAFDAFDMKICNLEGCLFDPDVLLQHKPGWRHCNRDFVKVLAELKINAAACANNVHFGDDAIKQSLSLLEKYNIGHAGAGMNVREARRPAIFGAKDTTFGLLSYTSVFWPIGQAATESKAGVASVKVYTSYEPHRRLFEMPGAPATTLTHPDEKQLQEVRNDIIELRKKVDVVIVYFHWGVSGQYEVCQYQTTLGRSAVDAGADLVVGSHPHVIQAVEIYKGKPIFYSLGNFIFGSDFKPARAYRNGLVAVAELRNHKISTVAAIPSALNEKEQPALLRPDQPGSAAIMDNVARLSSTFGTKLSHDDNRYLLLAT